MERPGHPPPSGFAATSGMLFLLNEYLDDSRFGEQGPGQRNHRTHHTDKNTHTSN
jgi:hypothetical protein